MKPRSNSCAGFSLMEILIAVAILGFVILGMTWAEQQKWRVLSRSGRTSEAMRVIEQQIEMRRIGALATKTLPDAGTTSITTRNGIIVRDSIGTAVDIFGTVMTTVRTIALRATWTGGKDTIVINTHLSKNF